MGNDKLRAMIGQQAGGRFSVAYSFGNPTFTDIEIFPSEREARAWIERQAAERGLGIEDIEYLPPHEQS